MLAFLLFAGALKVGVDFNELLGQKWAVGVLATVGVVASTFLVGGLTWTLSHLLGAGLGVIECLLFGALISPTDPIAVMAMLRSVSVPKSIEGVPMNFDAYTRATTLEGGLQIRLVHAHRRARASRQHAAR